MAADIDILDKVLGIGAAPAADEGWFVAVRGLYVNIEHKTCVVGFGSGRMQPTRFESEGDALKAAVAFRGSLSGRDALLPISVVHRARVMHETEYDIVAAGTAAPSLRRRG